MTHLWLRAEQRPNEKRAPLTHEGAETLIESGIRLSVEHSSARILDVHGYERAGAEIVPENSWPSAPESTVILGVKELPDDGSPLIHRHIMFGHAYKGQSAGQALLQRFIAGGGVLYDLEYLLDENNQRISAFGYWAGFAGAAVSVKAWLAQQQGSVCDALSDYANKADLLEELQTALIQLADPAPSVIVIGALGRVGSGAADLCDQLGMSVTAWDMEDTRRGGPFLQILEHTIFLNCIVANKQVPPFVEPSWGIRPKALSVIGDIACDPDCDYNPVPLYERVTSWEAPVLRVCEQPVLDIMAIDNLPSLLPLESSIDFSAQLLPALLQIGQPDCGVWKRAANLFERYAHSA